MNLVLWKNVHLDDYEKHLNHPKLSITKVLNGIFKNQMKEYGPDSVTIWGIAGGAILEQAKDLAANEIVGIDINQKFLDICSQRFKSEFPRLKLKQMDLDAPGNKIFKTDFIWAPLIFNYLTNNKLNLKYASDSLEDNGVISIVGFSEDVTVFDKELPVSKALNVAELEKIAASVDLHLIESNLVATTGGVKLQVLDFIKNKDRD